MAVSNQVEPELKLCAVKEYLKGTTSLNRVAEKYCVSRSTLQKWLLNYGLFGKDGLTHRTKNQRYSEKTKRLAVAMHLAGHFGIDMICKKYQTIQHLNQKQGWPVGQLCKAVGVSRAAYYKWLNRTASKKQSSDEKLAGLIFEIYQAQHGIPGYRQMRIILERRYGIRYDPKRVYRLMRVLGLQSICRRKNIALERKPLLNILQKIY